MRFPGLEKAIADSRGVMVSESPTADKEISKFAVHVIGEEKYTIGIGDNLNASFYSANVNCLNEFGLNEVKVGLDWKPMSKIIASPFEKIISDGGRLMLYNDKKDKEKTLCDIIDISIGRLSAPIQDLLKQGRHSIIHWNKLYGSRRLLSKLPLGQWASLIQCHDDGSIELISGGINMEKALLSAVPMLQPVLQPVDYLRSRDVSQ